MQQLLGYKLLPSEGADSVLALVQVSGPGHHSPPRSLARLLGCQPSGVPPPSQGCAALWAGSRLAPPAQ